MYGHPYTPYEVQKRFMADLYEVLSTKKVALFESPTGTGKTLSLLCPSVSWLRDVIRRSFDDDLRRIDSSGGPTWVTENAKKMRIAEYESERQVHHDLMKAAKLATEHAKRNTGPPGQKRRLNGRDTHSTIDRSGRSELDQFVLDDKNSAVDDALSLFNQVSTEGAADEDASLEPLKTATKIFFASRTHSQLTQVADALSSLKLDEPVRFITLGSRRQLCIHPDVTRLPSINQMNEKCADLQKHGNCSFRHNTAVVRNQALGQIMDIEDLAQFGKSHNGCPYYAARETVDYAEVVALPYPLLISHRNRSSLGINLTDAVVIIDEAHNLVDTVTSLHSASLSASAVQRALTGLKAYNDRVGSRLSPNNRRKVHQVIQLVKSLALYFESLTAETVKPGMPVDQSKLFAQGNVDTLDIAELNEFVRDSKLVFKVDSYLQAVAKQADATAPNKPSSDEHATSSSLGNVMDFVLVATDPLAEGKLYHDVVQDDKNRKATSTVLRYLVLDASYAFRDIVEESKAVVLAGGTMEPVSEFIDYLVPYLVENQIAKKSYSHIVPRSQLLVMPISDLKLTFATRNSPQVIHEVGTTLLKIVELVPNGVVAFFPGYKYLAYVVEAWKKSGIMAQLEAHKRVFTETNQATDVYAKYSGHAVSQNGSGALLLAVVGGRLSEGINFSDALARAVVMVGLPFPNAFSAEMVAKRNYIEQHAMKTQQKSKTEATEMARQYYENLAMRAVNQSVGRAIRHIGDYAAIYLIDGRYKTSGIQMKLSRWIRDSIDSSGQLEQKTRQFFSQNATPK